MRSNRAVFEPVSPDSLNTICEWLKQHSLSSSVFAKETNNFRREYGTTTFILNQLRVFSADVVDRQTPLSITGSDHRLSDLRGVCVLRDHKCKTIRKNVSYARKVLKYASKDLADKCADFYCAGDQFTLVWKDFPKADQANLNSFIQSGWLKEPPRVEIIRSNYQGSFSDPFTRGIFSLADDWGIEVVYKREFDAERPETLRQQIEEILSDRIKGGIRPIEAVVVNRGNPSDIAVTIQKARKNGIFVMTAGLPTSEVSINNYEMGQLLSEAVCQDNETIKFRNVLLLGDKNVMSPVQLRELSFQDALKEAGVSASLIHNALVGDFRDKAKEQILRFAQGNEFSRKTTAVVALSPPILEGVLAAFDVMQEVRTKVAVYGFGLTELVIQTMRRYPRFLRAVCGVDPFYYGRYVFRAALHRAVTFKNNKSEVKFRNVEPVIVTPETLDRDGIYNASLIAETHPDLKMHERTDEYAWAEWMNQLRPQD